MRVRLHPSHVSFTGRERLKRGASAKQSSPLRRSNQWSLKWYGHQLIAVIVVLLYSTTLLSAHGSATSLTTRLTRTSRKLPDRGGLTSKNWSLTALATRDGKTSRTNMLTLWSLSLSDAKNSESLHKKRRVPRDGKAGGTKASSIAVYAEAGQA